MSSTHAINGPKHTSIAVFSYFFPNGERVSLKGVVSSCNAGVIGPLIADENESSPMKQTEGREADREEDKDSQPREDDEIKMVKGTKRDTVKGKKHSFFISPR